MRLIRIFCIVIAFACLAPTPGFPQDARLAAAVLREMNAARTSPGRYADHLRALRRHYRGRSFRMPDSRAWITTKEGVAAVDEAIRYMARQKPLPPLQASAKLAAAAEELVRDEGPSGATGHEGEVSGGVRERVGRHGQWRKRIGENISYGPLNARLIVAGLIIDDGVKDRGHRENIYDPVYRSAGVACGPHRRYGSMCVIDFAGGFE